MARTTGLSAARIPTEDVVIGDKIALYGLTYMTVEWKGKRADGGWHLAGTKNDGDAHVSSLSAGALVSRIFQVKEESDGAE